MEKSTTKLGNEIYNDLKKDYPAIERINMENETSFRIYADDETLWKIFEEMINQFKSIEFNAGIKETHFLEVII
ncbi:MAG: hypothetical protein PHY59_09585 [Methanobacterium sp.]|nr:hypothetical protein [Methanobacterium sp.]